MVRIMQKMEYMELQMCNREVETEALRRDLQSVRQKEESKAYTQMWGIKTRHRKLMTQLQELQHCWRNPRNRM